MVTNTVTKSEAAWLIANLHQPFVLLCKADGLPLPFWDLHQKVPVMPTLKWLVMSVKED